MVALLLVASCRIPPPSLDVLPEYHNREVTALVEDSESVRLALGAAWDDALACRAMSGYLRPWAAAEADEAAEGLVRRGADLYELVKCVDDGIGSARLARDSRDAPELARELKFWRNELALAARRVVTHASEAAALKGRLEKQFGALAHERGIAAETIGGRPWTDPQREAWRRAGPIAGVRLPLDPWPGSYPEWWNRHLSLAPGYLVGKLRSAGDAFVTPETPIGAWGSYCTGEGQYDWTELKPQKRDPHAWGGLLMGKYRTTDAIRAALGDDYKDGYGWRLPFDYTPQTIKIDYLHFRRVWVQEYLAIKRRLVEAAFPDKLIIAEMRQFGDHDGIQGLGEKKWGGFLADDHAQWSGVGPENARRPFTIRSVGPPGFGTRPSDSLESLFRDYLWLHFRDPGNLTRYFYHWVAHGYMDYQLGWHSVTNHWLTNRLLCRLGPTVANTAPLPERIGLLMPRATLDLFDGPVYYSYVGCDWALHAAKLPYTRIDEHLVRDGRLRTLPLEALILPEAQAMDAKVAAEIEAWVARGGLLIASEMPGRLDEYGRPLRASRLAKALGVSLGGTTSEAVKGTPLTITVPHGHYSGKWAKTTDRRPPFQILTPATAKVLASYESGKPAITINAHGKGRAVTLGYPFGREAVECERTSIGFQRTYVWFVREPQLVARAAWLRSFLTEQLGYRPDYGVGFADVGRFKGNEAIAPDLHTPKGLSQDPRDPFFARTVGDPRPGHELEVDREAPDLAVRFFPRGRDGLATRYLGISTREVHYLGPRATVNTILARHAYRCRINNPRIQAIWDVGLSVPVGFERDERGVSFDVSLPSGHIMMLAVSESSKVQLFAPAPFPGREKNEVLARCRRLAGGRMPRPVAVLTPADELRPWLEELATPSGKGGGRKETVWISYGQEANRSAAEKLAACMRERSGIDVETIEQAVKRPDKPEGSIGKEYEKPVVLIGDEWTNNDLAMHGAYWGIAYGAHMPFTATHMWPGPGRAVVSLSRRHALIDKNGRHPFAWNDTYRLRPVERRFPLVRRKLHIAANGADAERAVGALLRMLGKER